MGRHLALAMTMLLAGVMALAARAGPVELGSPRPTASVVRTAAAGTPLWTAIDDAAALGDVAGQASFGEHVRAAGARFVRAPVRWRFMVPGGGTKPVGFDARNPADPRYRWGDLDRAIGATAAHGLIPLLFIYTAPDWAQSGQRQRPGDGPVRPSATDLADFATAVATRYGGGFAGLPRVRYWQIWNEPNLSIYLNPQSENGELVSPDWYRSMVNAFASAVHAIHTDNVVVAGGLAPFGGNLNDPSAATTPNQERVHPLEFMREMLCMSGGSNPRPTCNERTEFDVWAHHPYTYGGPTHSAFHPDDVSLGDLGQMRRLLEAAQAAGHVESRQKVGYWVTEFSYDSQPADPKGLAPALHARWVSEALYRMWSHGVSVVTWFRLRDDPFPQDMFQSGLYLRGANGIASDKPKPALKAFRFPFVAFRQKNGTITFWGRTPAGVKKAIVVEQRTKRWKRVATPTVDRYGIFAGRVKSRGGGPFRASLTNRSEVSLPFSLTVPEDFRFCPWGSFC